MIILIGGATHVGKTLLSQKLIEKFHYPCTSLDHLKMGFIRSGRTELTVKDDYKMRFWLWPFAAEMIKTAIENNQNMIMEGCYIPKQWKDSFSSEYLKEVRCVFIVMTEKYIRNHFQVLYDYANVIENRLEDKLDIERLINCNVEFKEDCIANGTPFIEIDENYNFEKILNQVIEIVKK